MTRRPTSRVRAMLASIVGPIAVVVIAVAAWALLKQALGIKDYLLPSPAGVLRAFTDDPWTFLNGMRETATSAAIGFAIAAAGGVLIGSVLSVSRTVERSVYPITLLFQMVPLVAIAPLLAIWFGLGRPAVVASTAIVAIFPLARSMRRIFELSLLNVMSPPLPSRKIAGGAAKPALVATPSLVLPPTRPAMWVSAPVRALRLTTPKPHTHCWPTEAPQMAPER